MRVYNFLQPKASCNRVVTFSNRTAENLPTIVLSAWSKTGSCRDPGWTVNKSRTEISGKPITNVVWVI